MYLRQDGKFSSNLLLCSSHVRTNKFSFWMR
jgi:hypothetical protein